MLCFTVASSSCVGLARDRTTWFWRPLVAKRGCATLKLFVFFENPFSPRRVKGQLSKDAMSHQPHFKSESNNSREKLTLTMCRSIIYTFKKQKTKKQSIETLYFSPLLSPVHFVLLREAMMSSAHPISYENCQVRPQDGDMVAQKMIHQVTAQSLRQLLSQTFWTEFIF